MYVTWEQLYDAIQSLRRQRNLQSVFLLLARNVDRLRVSARRSAARAIGEMYDILALRAVKWRIHKRAVVAARQRFRKAQPPWFACDRCIMTFTSPLQWRAHAERGCPPKYVRAMVESFYMRQRPEEREVDRFQARHPKPDAAPAARRRGKQTVPTPRLFVSVESRTGAVPKSVQ
jgi:hypothetical protein